ASRRALHSHPPPATASSLASFRERFRMLAGFVSQPSTRHPPPSSPPEAWLRFANRSDCSLASFRNSPPSTRHPPRLPKLGFVSQHRLAVVHPAYRRMVGRGWA